MVMINLRQAGATGVSTHAKGTEEPASRTEEEIVSNLWCSKASGGPRGGGCARLPSKALATS